MNEAAHKSDLAKEMALAMMGMPEAVCKTTDLFCGGVYIREMKIPAGVTVVGHMHKTEHFTELTSGRVLLSIDGEAREIVAPALFKAQPGRKVCHAITESIVRNIFSTDETDVEKLEEILLDKSELWVQQVEERKDGPKLKE